MATIEAVTTSGAVLGAVLIKLRVEKGMNQGELAAEVGIGSSTWSRIEKGDSGLSIEQLRLAAKALGVKPGLILEMAEASEQNLEQQGVRINTSWNEAKAVVDAMTTLKAAAPGASIGAAIGTVIPVVGTALGALIGGTVANFLQRAGKDAKEK